MPRLFRLLMTSSSHWSLPVLLPLQLPLQLHLIPVPPHPMQVPPPQPVQRSTPQSTKANWSPKSTSSTGPIISRPRF